MTTAEFIELVLSSKLKRKEMAEKLCISESFLSRVVTNKDTPSNMLLALAEAIKGEILGKSHGGDWVRIPWDENVKSKVETSAKALGLDVSSFIAECLDSQALDYAEEELDKKEKNKRISDAASAMYSASGNDEARRQESSTRRAEPRPQSQSSRGRRKSR